MNSTTLQPDLKAPFPYFGGKSRVADLVWRYLGDVDNYIEPFCGSAAVLLRRPHPARIETLNDADCMVANFWRATGQDPEAVAEHADHPVNEADLHARHRWLVLSPEAAAFRERMRRDPGYFDAKIAGWWCWGLCCWIGGGWCTAKDCETKQYPRLTNDVTLISAPDLENGKRNRKPRIDDGEGQQGHGVHAKGDTPQTRPNLNGTKGGAISNAGVHSEPWGDGNRPQLADAFARGRGVNGNDLAEVCADRRAWLVDWFSRLRDRLRTVRVCCGDWLRVCDSDSVTTRLGTTGIFFDAPYKTTLADGSSNRDANLYATDGAHVDGLVDRVITYCVERGSNPKMRIVACCYEGEGYEILESIGWTCLKWAAAGGYGNRSAKGKANAKRERLYISPHCLKNDGLFDECK